MVVESIELYNYRNLESAKTELSPGVNIFYGDNAQGKTNFLESLYLSSTTRSHRGSRDRDLIRFGQEEAHIRMMFRKDQLTHRLDVHLRKNKAKGIAVDGALIRKTSQLMGMIPIIFFSPEDLSIIKAGPSLRRRFMDMELSQLDPMYMSHLVRYNKIVSERNSLLKQISLYPTLSETLEGWDRQMIPSARYIIDKREQFCQDINCIMGEIHELISGGKETIRISYENNTDINNIEDRLLENRNKDILSGSTSVGPHRDDIKISVNEIDLRKFGSQGQQRTAALSLKLSEIRLIESAKKEKPVLLLDDVFSELDRQRQNHLLFHIKDIQTLVSCTGIDDFVGERMKIDKVFHVSSGVISAL